MLCLCGVVLSRIEVVSATPCALSVLWLGGKGTATKTERRGVSLPDTLVARGEQTHAHNYGTHTTAVHTQPSLGSVERDMGTQ